jgi:hypothetical protein
LLAQHSTQTILRKKADELQCTPPLPGQAEVLRELVQAGLGAPASIRQICKSRLDRLRAGQVVLLAEVLLARMVVDNELDLLTVTARLCETYGQAIEGASGLGGAAEELKALRDEITAACPGLDQFAPPDDRRAMEQALARLADLEIMRIAATADLEAAQQALARGRAEARARGKRPRASRSPALARSAPGRRCTTSTPARAAR